MLCTTLIQCSFITCCKKNKIIYLPHKFIFTKGLYLFVAVCFLSLNACKKSSNSSLPIINNEVKATLSIESAGPFELLATGDNTLFTTYIDTTNRDTVTTVLGGYQDAQLEVILVNITKPGIYTFREDDNPGAQYSFCEYIVGNPFNPTQMYSTLWNGTGEVVIDSFSRNYIQGSFFATCNNGNRNKVVQVTSGSFSGNF